MSRLHHAEPQRVTRALLQGRLLPDPARAGGKEVRGRVLVIAGGREMPGIAALAGEAALRAGAGKVRVVVPEAVAASVGTALPEGYVIGVPEEKGREEVVTRILKSAEQAAAVLIGPGVTDEGLVKELVPPLLELKTLRTLVADASAMPLAVERLRGQAREGGPAVILTPHHGEMAALTGRPKEAISRDPLAAVSEAVEELDAVIVLKEAATHLASRGEGVFLHEEKNPGLGTAGSGDVLAGVMAGLCARGAEPMTAALWAVWLHAAAGKTLARRVGTVGFLARELALEVARKMGRM